MGGTDKAGGFWLGTFMFLLVEAGFMAFVKFTNLKTPSTETLCAAFPITDRANSDGIVAAASESISTLPS